MKRFLLLTFAVVACDGSVTEPAAKPSLDVGVAVAGVCTPTPFRRDGRVLTAAVIGTAAPITRTVVDATGCDIGIYYAPGTTGSVDQSTIAGASYFGVVNHSAAVDVTRSSVSNIGDRPFSGAQHGNAIFYTTENEVVGTDGSSTIIAAGSASGTISGNSVSLYQKGGIIVRGVGASAEILDNEVRGLGPVNFIAQSENDYTPPGTTSCGILLFDAAGVKVQQNTYFDNETNMCNFGKGGGNVSE